MFSLHGDRHGVNEVSSLDVVLAAFSVLTRNADDETEKWRSACAFVVLPELARRFLSSW